MDPNHQCTVVLKSGVNAGETCPNKACFYHPVRKEYYCKRHNKFTKEETDRIALKKSCVLCVYDPPLCLGDDIDEAMKKIKPDDIGEAYIKEVLNGYINMRFGYPFLYEEMPLVCMSKLSGFGDHFDRASLAKCLKETIEYIMSRPDAYTWNPDATLDKLCLSSIWLDKFIGQYIVDLHLVE